MIERERGSRRVGRGLKRGWVRLKAQPERLLAWLRENRVVQAGVSLYRRSPFLWQCALLVGYRLALDVLYLKFISPFYGYVGFTTDLTPLRWVVSLLAVAVFTPWVVRLPNREGPSNTVVFLLSLLYFVPLTCYYGCRGASPGFFLAATLYWAVLLAAQYRLPVLRLRGLSGKYIPKLFNLLAVCSMALVFYVCARYTHFRLTLDFINVYGIRTEAATYSLPTLLSYGLSMLSFLLPFLLLYYLLRRKWVWAGALLVTCLFHFSIGAHKSFFFMILATLAAYALYRRWMLQWAPLELAAGAGVCLALRSTGLGLQLVSLFYRRFMFTPIRLSDCYHTFFSCSPLNLFRNGLLGKLGFDPVYSISIPRVIAQQMLQQATNANNGLVGDAFANLPGYVGIFLMPVVLVLTLRLLDAVSHRLDPRVTFVVCLYFSSSFMNTTWGTVLLSNGFLLACAVLYLFPREREDLNP